MFGLAVFAVLAGTGIAMFGAYESNLLKAELAHDALQGRNITILSSANPNHQVSISRASCEGLTRMPGVLRAGLMVSEGTYDLPQVGRGLPMLGASAELFPQLLNSDVLVGTDLRPRDTPFTIALPDGLIGRAITATRQPVGLDTNSSVVTGLVPAMTSGPTCYVIFDQFAKIHTGEIAVASAVQATGGAVAARVVFTDTINPITSYANRATRYLPLLLGLCGGVIGGILNRVRGSEMATYRLAGSSPRSVALILILEQAFLAGIMLSCAIATTILTGKYLVSGFAAELELISGACLWICVAAAMAADIPFRRPTSLANER
jgi:hypothetical protein